MPQSIWCTWSLPCSLFALYLVFSADRATIVRTYTLDAPWRSTTFSPNKAIRQRPCWRISHPQILKPHGTSKLRVSQFPTSTPLPSHLTRLGTLLALLGTAWAFIIRCLTRRRRAPPTTEGVLPPPGSTIIDLRDCDDFSTGHLPGSTSIPVAELFPRLFELPPPGPDHPLALVGAPAALAQAKAVLCPKGWVVAAEVPPHRLSQGLETGAHSVRSWRPSDFLAEVLPQFIPHLTALPADCHVALDVGCGSGRDAVFLALELPPSWTVCGLDNHGDALLRTGDLARRTGVTVQALSRDLRRPGCLEEFYGRVGLVHGSRFLDRALLAEVRDYVLAPGGVFIWGTFMEGERNAAPPYRPGRRLQAGELRETFRAPDFTVLHDSIGTLTTRGVPVPAAFFACVKHPQLKPMGG